MSVMPIEFHMDFFLIPLLFSFEITDGVFVLVNHDVIFSINFFHYFFF